jgi:glycosyltransferase involved in cell wall biosynthesis
MRIAFISSYLPQPCGIATYTYYLTEAFRRKSPATQISVLAEGEARPQRGSATDVRTVFRFDSEYVDAVLSAVDELSPDVVHIQHEYGIFGLDERFPRLLTGLRRLQCPTVVTLHTVHTNLSMDLGCGTWRGRPPIADLDIELYQKQIGDLADLVVVHQDEPIRQVLVRQGLTSGRLVTVPHGTLVEKMPSRTAARCSLGIAEDVPLLVSFGYLESAKNIPTLIEAIELLHGKGIKAHARLGGYVRNATPAGHRLRRNCEELVNNRGLAEYVRFMDRPIDEECIPTFFAAADVACFVYDEDTRCASGALHRSMGCGATIVASRIPKFHELTQVADEILVNPRSPSEIARMLERLILDLEFRDSIQSSVLDYARSTAWPRIASRHLEIYQSLTEQRSTDPASQTLAREAVAV